MGRGVLQCAGASSLKQPPLSNTTAGGLCSPQGEVLNLSINQCAESCVNLRDRPEPRAGQAEDWLGPAHNGGMRRRAEILHLDLDAFFAAVEQRDKPSLQGRPVIVGGQGGRSVVAAASYEARAFGVRSAMPTAQARRLCPQAAILVPRFPAYQAASRAVMQEVREFSDLVEQVSIDEAYADLAALPSGSRGEPDSPVIRARSLRARVYARTGLRASIGLAPSKSLAKLASEAAKPDGLRVIFPREAQKFLRALPARALPGVGPTTGARLAAIGVHRVGDLAKLPEAEAERVLGAAHGRNLLLLARGEDRRPIVPYREVKSISVESTFDQDLVARDQVELALDQLARRLAERLHRAGAAGHTITVKFRYADFSLRTRSASPKGSVAQFPEIAALARRIVAELDPNDWRAAGGIRLLGIAVSGLADWIQSDLWGDECSAEQGDKDHLGTDPHGRLGPPSAGTRGIDHSGATVGAGTTDRGPQWLPGADVTHSDHGRGWVWGSGRGRVTVRFEYRGSPLGQIRTFNACDPELAPLRPVTDGD